MSYTKAIVYGDYLETYYYERNPIISERSRGSNKSRTNNTVVADDVLDCEQSEVTKARREDSARRTELAFRRLILANLRDVEFPVLVTLTYAELQADIGVARKDFANFQKRASRIFKNWKYICVPEFQKRGAVHFHAMCWGIPESVVRHERSTRLVAELWGKGFVDLKRTDGSFKLAYYLAKYLGKAHIDSRLFGKRAYSASKNIERPQVVTHVQEWALLKEFELSTDDLLRQRDFETIMLGKGRFRLYKKQSHANNSNSKADVQVQNRARIR